MSGFLNVFIANRFSPRLLFAAGEKGVWYDPSDLSTLWQDSARTTAVTAVEQPVGCIDDKSGNGANATQPTAASRPVLSARVNLLTYTEDFTNAAWTKINVTAVLPTVVSADEISFPAIVNAGDISIVRQAFTSQAAEYIGAVELKAKAAGDVGKKIGLYINDGSPVNFVYHTLTADWVRVAVTETTSATTSYLNVGVLGSTYGGQAQGAVSVNIRRADLRVSNVGVGLPAYQRVGAATDYDTTGFPYYLKADGTDDGLVSSSIDFSATDKMAVFAGVRKLSDASQGVVAELSASAPGNAGAFALSAPGGGLGDYAFYSRGSVAPAGGSRSLVASPSTNVVSGIADIPADQALVRVNGVGATPSTSDQGAGNYGNYPLYVARRGGSTLPFNGHIYGLVIVGRALSAAEITNTETWLNSKTKAF